MPSPQELNERFGGSFSDWVNNTLLPHFGDMPSRSLSPTQKMNAVMGYLLRQNFESLIKDNRESGKHYLTLVGVRMILVENGPPRQRVDELTMPLMEYQPMGGRINGSPGLGTPGTVHNPGEGFISIPVDSTHTLNILMEFNYLFNH